MQNISKTREIFRLILSIMLFTLFLIIGFNIYLDKKSAEIKAKEFINNYINDTATESDDSDNLIENDILSSDSSSSINSDDNEDEKVEYDYYNAILSLIKDDDENYNKKLMELANDIKENNNANSFFRKNEQYIKNLLKDTKFLGDSNVYHITRFNLLPLEYIGAMRGKSTTEQLNLVQEKIDGNEKNLIFWNGYNIKYFKDSNDFVESYKKLIDKIHTINSECNVYICSLLPAADKIVEDDLKSDFVHNIYRGPEYDKALENAFKDSYINTKMFFFSEEQYQNDMVHMNADFSKMLISYVAMYINRDKTKSANSLITLDNKNEETDHKKTFATSSEVTIEESNTDKSNHNIYNKYYDSGIFDVSTIEVNKRYAYDNLELFYQYEQFIDGIGKGVGPSYYKNNSEYVKQILSNTCFIGDSNVVGIEKYKLLDSEHVISFGGIGLNKIIQKIENDDDVDVRNFDNIVLWNGYNIKYIKNDVGLIEEYNKLIKAIRKQNATCKIYICSLLPASNEKILEDISNGSPHDLHKGEEYDNALKNYYNDSYINTKIFIHNNYVEDGIHLRNDFYQVMIPYVGFYINFMEIKKNVFIPKKHLTKEDIEPTTEKEIYITFDDGPSYYTEELLDILREKSVKVTFFVTNQNEKYINLLKRMDDEGHNVAVHTYMHNPNIYSSKETYFDDLYKMECVVRREIGKWSKIIRFIGGGGNISSKESKIGIMTELTELVQDLGYVYYDWNVSSGDGAFISEQKTLENVINGLQTKKEKYIILFHDPKKTTVNIVGSFIDFAKENGYVFKTINENTLICHHNLNN